MKYKNRTLKCAKKYFLWYFKPIFAIFWIIFFEIIFILLNWVKALKKLYDSLNIF